MLGGCSVAQTLTKFDTANFSTDGLWQFTAVMNLAWILIRSGYFLDMILKLSRKLLRGRISLCQNDESADYLRPLGIVLTDNGRLQYGRMLDKCRLHLERADSIRGGGDHIIGAAREPEVAILIHQSPVSGIVPTGPKRLL